MAVITAPDSLPEQLLPYLRAHGAGENGRIMEKPHRLPAQRPGSLDGSAQPPHLPQQDLLISVRLGVVEPASGASHGDPFRLVSVVMQNIQ